MHLHRTLFVALLVWNGSPAMADTVTITFSGTVTEIVDPEVLALIGETVEVGDVLTGTATYDLDAEGIPIGTGEGGVVIRTLYESPVPPASLSYTVGSLSTSTAAGDTVATIVTDGAPGEIGEDDMDGFIWAADTSSPVPLSSVFRLEDTSRSVYSDTSLPQGFDIDDFDRRRFEARALGMVFVFASIDAISVSRDVAIDVRPRSTINWVSPGEGRIRVAILSDGDALDPSTVDPATVRFGATGTEAAPIHSVLRDVDGDGVADLVLRFVVANTGIECGDTTAELTGETFEGTQIRGTDTIETVGCGS